MIPATCTEVLANDHLFAEFKKIPEVQNARSRRTLRFSNLALSQPRGFKQVTAASVLSAKQRAKNPAQII
jgi:hypothetical protein